MNLVEILHSRGFFSSDIKQFISNKQLQLNGEILDFNKLKEIEFKDVFDTGIFIYENIELFRDFSFLSIDEIFSANIPVIRNKLKDISFLRINKQTTLILK